MVILDSALQETQILFYLNGLSVAPAILKSIVDTAFPEANTISQLTSMYIDDIYVNESILFMAHIQQSLTDYTLLCKELEQLKNGALVPGFYD